VAEGACDRGVNRARPVFCAHVAVAFCIWGLQYGFCRLPSSSAGSVKIGSVGALGGMAGGWVGMTGRTPAGGSSKALGSDFDPSGLILSFPVFPPMRLTAMA